LAKSIQGEASRLSRIVTNLLDVTTLESGQVRLNQQPYFIQEIIGSALSRLESLLAGRVVQTHATDNLPMAMVDGMLIDQVLQNLIENAVHHTTPQSTITINATLKGNEIMVTVSDKGGGILAGEEEKIFDKFYTVIRGETHKGTGLGLAICAGIIRAHGGHIWVSNLPEGGAKFCFTLPLADQSKLGVPDDLST
jgi:two-component system sensor histidine kinase KdpD